MAVKKALNNRLKTMVEFVSLSGMDILSILGIFRLSTIIRTDLLPHIYAGFPPEPLSGTLLVHGGYFSYGSSCFTMKGFIPKDFLSGMR